MTARDPSRRAFLRSTTGAALTLSAVSYSRVMGANDRMGVAVVGCGDRGQYIMELFQQFPGIQVVAACDIYGERVRGILKTASGARGFEDHRDALELKEVDVVIVGTPDHWHAAISIDAMNAGKDVYVEKPMTFKMEEGPLMIKAARLNKRICQVGMQQRSGPHYLQARDDFIQAGKLGKISLVRTWWHSYTSTPLKLPLREKPADLNWERFLGQVKWREWNPYQYFDYRGYLDYGGGKITDLFTHWIDAVHMLMGQDNPVSAVAAGGVYFPMEGRTAPDTISLALEYPNNWTVTFESASLPNMPEYGMEFCGIEGRLSINRSAFEFTPAEKGGKPILVKPKREITIDHIENFLDCCRTRKLPQGDVYFGHRGAQASHLATMAYIQKRRIRFDPDREEVLV